jgi:AraC-like DNA-binding protein
MNEKVIEQLMDLLDVQVSQLSVHELESADVLGFDAADQILVYFVLRGSGAIESDARKFPAAQGTVILMPRNLPSALRGETPFAVGRAVISASLGGVIDVFEHMWEPMVEDGTVADVRPVLGLIESEVLAGKVGTRAIVAGLMKSMLLDVFRSQISRESFRSWLWPGMMNPQLGRAALAIMARPQDPHTVDSLAALAGISRSRFTELFMEAFDRNPIEFLQAVRLRAARRLLLSSRLPVKSVAAAVGYQSRSHFCRVFQAKYGDAPSAFRTRMEQQLVQGD